MIEKGTLNNTFPLSELVIIMLEIIILYFIDSLSLAWKGWNSIGMPKSLMAQSRHLFILIIYSFSALLVSNIKSLLVTSLWNKISWWMFSWLHYLVEKLEHEILHKSPWAISHQDFSQEYIWPYHISTKGIHYSNLWEINKEGFQLKGGS